MDYSDNRGTSSTAWEDETDDFDQNSIQRLTRFWMNERNAPDILMWQGQLVEDLLDNLHNQVRRIVSH